MRTAGSEAQILPFSDICESGTYGVKHRDDPERLEGRRVEVRPRSILNGIYPEDVRGS